MGKADWSAYIETVSKTLDKDDTIAVDKYLDLAFHITDIVIEVLEGKREAYDLDSNGVDRAWLKKLLVTTDTVEIVDPLTGESLIEIVTRSPEGPLYQVSYEQVLRKHGRRFTLTASRMNVFSERYDLEGNYEGLQLLFWLPLN